MRFRDGDSWVDYHHDTVMPYDQSESGELPQRQLIATAHDM